MKNELLKRYVLTNYKGDEHNIYIHDIEDIKDMEIKVISNDEVLTINYKDYNEVYDSAILSNNPRTIDYYNSCKNIDINDLKDTLKNYEKIQIHPGNFHMDDLMCVILAQKINPNIEIIRGGKPMLDDSKVLVADFGNSKYDHHDTTTAQYRENGIKYSACGLMFKEFGDEIFLDKNIRKVIENNIIQGIDAIDNGQPELINNFGTSLSNVVSSLNKSWDDTRSDIECFNNALSLVKTLVDNEINKIISKQKALDIVQCAYENKNKEDKIIVFNQFVPAKEYYMENTNDVYYIAYPSNRGGWNLEAIPPNKENWTKQRCSITQTGKNIEGVNFIHPAGFLANVDSPETAKKLADLSIKTQMLEKNNKEIDDDLNL